MYFVFYEKHVFTIYILTHVYNCTIYMHRAIHVSFDVVCFTPEQTFNLFYFSFCFFKVCTWSVIPGSIRFFPNNMIVHVLNFINLHVVLSNLFTVRFKTICWLKIQSCVSYSNHISIVQRKKRKYGPSTKRGVKFHHSKRKASFQILFHWQFHDNDRTRELG